MSTDQGTVAVLCGWEGNRRSGVALAMRRRLRDISTYGTIYTLTNIVA